jgi:predicted Rdx family selenoprotein
MKMVNSKHGNTWWKLLQLEDEDIELYRYLISKDGIIFDIKLQKTKIWRKNQHGAIIAAFNETRKIVARLVLSVFVEPKDRSFFVAYKDGDKSNINISNLYWCKASEVISNAKKNGKFSEEDILKIRLRAMEEDCFTDIATDYSTDPSTICKIVTGGTHRYSAGPIRKPNKKVNIAKAKLSKHHLTEKQIIHLREEYADGERTEYLSRKYSITGSSISRIARGESWGYIGGPRTERGKKRQR